MIKPQTESKIILYGVLSKTEKNVVFLKTLLQYHQYYTIPTILFTKRFHKINWFT